MSVQSIEPDAAGPTVWRLSWVRAIVVLAVGLMGIWPFWDGLVEMWGTWMGTPEYSHGLLIPPIAAFLVYQQKHRLERIAFTGSWWGVALLVVGGALLVLGQLATVYTIVQYAFLVSLYGLVLAFLGWPATRVVAVPLLILLFMIPLPAFFLNNLSTKLQLLSSQIGVAFIRMFDVSVFLEGNVIDLGSYKLEVAEACSGLRYLFPLMTIGFLMAYLYKGANWKRIVLFLSSIPITVIMNSLRVGVIGVTVDRWGIGMAEGLLHEVQGWMVFMASTALMLGEIAMLNRIGAENGTWRQLFGLETPAPSPVGATIRPRALPTSFIVASLLLLGSGVVANVVPRTAERVPGREAFVRFPAEISGWHGHREALEAIVTDQLKMDDYLLANYVEESGGLVNFYVSYYDSQRKGEAVHSPRACLPGGGWQFKAFDQRELPGISLNGRPLRVNRALIELGDQRQLVYYWFQQRGRVIDNEFAVKWYLFVDAVFRHRTDGAMVRLITPLPAMSSEAQADARLAGFAGRVAPMLAQFVPN